MVKFKKLRLKAFKFVKKNLFFILIILLFLLNIAQFSYLYYQNQQLARRLLTIDRSWRGDLADTKQVVTTLSAYFENKGNITLEALLKTVDQLQVDETSLKTTIDTINNNVAIANNNSNIANSQYSHLQTQVCILSNGYLCK